MSKSDDDVNGCVRLLDDVESIQRKFKRAVTDSGTEIKFDEARPAITNLLTIYQLLTGSSTGAGRVSFRRRRLRPIETGTGRRDDRVFGAGPEASLGDR